MTELVFLGTGTSRGVPMIGCDCPVCTSNDPRNKRTRASVLLRVGGRAVLIDASPELRLQCLSCGVERVDVVLLSHGHADHVFGIDDLVRFNILQGGPLPIYGSETTLAEVCTFFAYAFRPPHAGGYRPSFELHTIEGPFGAAGMDVIPLPALHGEVPVLGYRIGSVAYLTDVNRIPPATLGLMRGLDVLVLDALRARPHPTHFSIDEALAVVAELRPARAFFTHISHETDHETVSRGLPPGVALAYDGLSVQTPSA